MSRYEGNVMPEELSRQERPTSIDVERNQQIPDGWVVTLVEQNEDATAPFPDYVQKINKPSSVGAQTVSKENLDKY